MSIQVKPTTANLTNFTTKAHTSAETGNTRHHLLGRRRIFSSKNTKEPPILGPECALNGGKDNTQAVSRNLMGLLLQKTEYGAGHIRRFFADGQVILRAGGFAEGIFSAAHF